MMRALGTLEHIPGWVLILAVIGTVAAIWWAERAIRAYAGRQKQAIDQGIDDIRDTLAPAPEREQVWKEGQH